MNRTIALRGRPLTPAERPVLAGLARGLIAKEIADALSLSTRTVEAHIYSAFIKLGVSGKPEFMARVQRRDVLREAMTVFVARGEGALADWVAAELEKAASALPAEGGS